jgi:diacylglycerol kinase
MINFKNLQKSFQSAFRGLAIAFKEEQTFRIQASIGLVVLFLTFFLALRSWERVVLILLIISVLGLELINSQIERILDFTHLGFHPKIKRIKDLSAAAVLVVSLGAALGGVFILLPPLLALF